MPTRGLFVTFEGGDGTGKTTQISLLAERLRAAGQRVVQTREPGGAPEAEAVRELIVKGEANAWSALSEALLMYAARAEHLRKLINPARESGAIVLCDRFSDSTMAYQGIAGGVGREAILALDALVVRGGGPDITFILDIEPAEGLRRASVRAGGNDRFENKGLAYHSAVREAFQSIAEASPERCILIDASRPPDTIHKIIAETVSRRLAKAETRGN